MIKSQGNLNPLLRVVLKVIIPLRQQFKKGIAISRMQQRFLFLRTLSRRTTLKKIQRRRRAHKARVIRSFPSNKTLRKVRKRPKRKLLQNQPGSMRSMALDLARSTPVSRWKRNRRKEAPQRR